MTVKPGGEDEGAKGAGDLRGGWRCKPGEGQRLSGSGKACGTLSGALTPCPMSPGLGEQPAGSHTAPQLGESGLRKKVIGAFNSLRRAAVGIAGVLGLIYPKPTRVCSWRRWLYSGGMAPDRKIVATAVPLVSPACLFDTRSVTTHFMRS